MQEEHRRIGLSLLFSTVAFDANHDDFAEVLPSGEPKEIIHDQDILLHIVLS